jgi:Protein of unknown function (DUF2934)
MNFTVMSGSDFLPLMSTNSPPAFDPLRFVKPTVSLKSREAMVAEIAYFRAQSRGFEPGHEVEDWLAAETEVDKRCGSQYDI